jgi:hypothetical protein
MNASDVLEHSQVQYAGYFLFAMALAYACGLAAVVLIASSGFAGACSRARAGRSTGRIVCASCCRFRSCW